MLTFLTICAFALAALVIGGLVAIPIFAVASLVWLVLLPFRLLFKLVFGLGGMLLGFVVAPFVMLIVGVALIGALIAALLALVAPLVPIVLLALFAWALYRLVSRHSDFPSSDSGFRS